MRVDSINMDCISQRVEASLLDVTGVSILEKHGDTRFPNCGFTVVNTPRNECVPRVIMVDVLDDLFCAGSRMRRFSRHQGELLFTLTILDALRKD